MTSVVMIPALIGFFCQTRCGRDERSALNGCVSLRGAQPAKAHLVARAKDWIAKLAEPQALSRKPKKYEK
jgi:hypothetical protein